MPEHVKNMALRWIEELHDWDVSRNITWGVPIPGSDDQVMYLKSWDTLKLSEKTINKSYNFV